MSEHPKLPGLSGKTEPELREIYTKHIGGDLPAEFDTVAKATAEIKRAFGEKYPTVAEAAPVATGTVHVTDAAGLPHDLPQAVWDNLGPRQEDYTLAADKPASLPKA